MKIMVHAILICVALVFFSCSKDGGKGPSGTSYPKTVDIEYRITSNSGLKVLNIMSYTNANGGDDTKVDQPLPVSVKLTRTVNRFETATVLARVNQSGNLNVEILVNNKVVISKPFTQEILVQGIVVHTFE